MKTYIVNFVGNDNKNYRVSVEANSRDDAEDEVFDSCNVRRITSIMLAA